MRQITPLVLKNDSAFPAESCRTAILFLNPNASQSLVGADVKYSAPDNPFARSHHGQQTCWPEHEGKGLHQPAL
jgi:hypothetical protein